jgi:hypothetical protein
MKRERLWGLLASAYDGALGSQSSNLSSSLIIKNNGIPFPVGSFLNYMNGKEMMSRPLLPIGGADDFINKQRL